MACSDVDAELGELQAQEQHLEACQARFLDILSHNTVRRSLYCVTDSSPCSSGPTGSKQSAVASEQTADIHPWQLEPAGQANQFVTSAQAGGDVQHLGGSISHAGLVQEPFVAGSRDIAASKSALTALALQQERHQERTALLLQSLDPEDLYARQLATPCVHLLAGCSRQALLMRALGAKHHALACQAQVVPPACTV